MQEGGLPDAVAWGKGPVVVSRPESNQRQEETEASQQLEEPRTANAVESEDDDVLEEIEVHPKDGRQHVYICHQCGDHFICHEEIPTADETRKVELVTKRLIAEV
jgi:rubrerythrin